MSKRAGEKKKKKKKKEKKEKKENIFVLSNRRVGARSSLNLVELEITFFFVSLQRNVMKSLSFVALFVTRNESFVYLFIVRASNRRALNRREERRINSNRSVSLHVYIYRCSIYLNICVGEGIYNVNV